jgi:hypothetical protein
MPAPASMPPHAAAAISKSARTHVSTAIRQHEAGRMDGRQSRSAARLWLEALRARWALRLISGEHSWELAWRTLRWLRLYAAQTAWLRTVDASPAMRRAARADPRLYERWQQPCIAPRFGPAARRRLLAAHYDFVQRRLPARMRERLLPGHDLRLAPLRLEGRRAASLHLRKPARAGAGELALLLLDGNRAPLAGCTLTFAGDDGLLVARLPDDPAPDDAELRAFRQGSHGWHPRDLLQVLVRELAAFHGLACVRIDPVPPEDGPRSERQEAFGRMATTALLDAFSGPRPLAHHPGARAQPCGSPAMRKPELRHLLVPGVETG